MSYYLTAFATIIWYGLTGLIGALMLRRCKVCGERKDIEGFPFVSSKEKGHRHHKCRPCYLKLKSESTRKRAKKKRDAEERRRCLECNKNKRLSLYPDPKASVCTMCVSRLKRETGVHKVSDYSYLLSTISEYKKKPLRLLSIQRQV